MTSSAKAVGQVAATKMQIGRGALLASTFVLATFASEATLASLVSDNNCSIPGVNTFTVDRINVTANSNYDDGAQVWATGGQGLSGVYSTCRGFYEGNDKNDGNVGGDAKPDRNIGWRDDGLLNFVEFDGLLTGSQSTQDIPGNPATDDPGWIRLGEADYDSESYSYESITYDTGPNGFGIDLGDYLEFSMDFSEAGTWSLKVNPDFVTLGQQRLGLDAFDHLAFVVKQGNKGGKKGPAGFAVYDFNFQQFIDQNILDQSTAYNFYGSFDLDGIHGNGFSHVSVWARDPVTTATNVPAPATLALFGLGLFGLGWSRRKRKA